MRASQFLSFTAALMALITASAAETPPAPATPAQAPVSADPQNTTATFGDWVVRCSRGPEAGAKRICEAVQSLVVKGQTAPIVQIAFGRADKDQMMTVLLPVEVAFAKPVTIGRDEAHAVTLTYRRCVPTGCFADAKADPAVLKDIRAATKPGRLTFLDAADRSIALPISFRGLPQALDELAKEDN